MSNNNEVKSTESHMNKFSELNKIAFIYFVASLLVLFTEVFVFRSEALNRDISEIGLSVFANGIGWFYYLVNIAGLGFVLYKPLSKLENLATKILVIANLVISVIVLFQLIPDAVSASNVLSNFQRGHLGYGFWLILLLHIGGVTFFWFKQIKSTYDKRKAKQNN